MQANFFFRLAFMALLFTAVFVHGRAQATFSGMVSSEYPKGIYATFEDFKIGTPSDVQTPFVERWTRIQPK